jgi:hypothetical protein
MFALTQDGFHMPLTHMNRLNYTSQNGSVARFVSDRQATQVELLEGGSALLSAQWDVCDTVSHLGTMKISPQNKEERKSQPEKLTVEPQNIVAAHQDSSLALMGFYPSINTVNKLKITATYQPGSQVVDVTLLPTVTYSVTPGAPFEIVKDANTVYIRVKDRDTGGVGTVLVEYEGFSVSVDVTIPSVSTRKIEFNPLPEFVGFESVLVDKNGDNPILRRYDNFGEFTVSDEDAVQKAAMSYKLFVDHDTKGMSPIDLSRHGDVSISLQEDGVVQDVLQMIRHADKKYWYVQKKPARRCGAVYKRR